jgi:hypothetical protein
MRKVHRETRLFIFSILGGLFLIGCYPGDIDNVAELDLAVTIFDEGADFSSNRTYAIADTVMEIGDGNIALTGQFDDLIVDKVQENMQALGYTEISGFSGPSPDVIVLISKTSSTNVDVYQPYPIWWDYWGYYPWWPVYGGIGPGWYPYYPWGGTVVYSYTSGTLIVELLDPDKLNADDTIPAISAGAINGLLEGSDSQIQGRLEENLDQLFTQSPYLNVQ